MNQKQRFLRLLAKYMADDQAMKSIELEMGKAHAKEWAELRQSTTLFGYPTVREAEVELGQWLGIEPAPE